MTLFRNFVNDSDEFGRDFVACQSVSSVCRKYLLMQVLSSFIEQTVLNVTDSIQTKDRARQPTVFSIRLFQGDFFPHGDTVLIGPGLTNIQGFSFSKTTPGRNTLDERSDWRRDLYLHNANLRTERRTCHRWNSNPQSQKRTVIGPSRRLCNHWDRYDSSRSNRQLNSII